ncbi:Lrp/AsnC family transcriptional regulator [soil metagenome]
MESSGLSSIDSTDFRILRELIADGRLTDVNLGERVHLSSTAAARRRKILEERGAISGYTAKLDANILGHGTVVIVALELSSQEERALKEFETAVVRCPYISFCSFVAGDTDFMMIVHVSSLQDYDHVYRKELSTLPHVSRIRSSFVIRQVAQRTIAPIMVSGAG